MRNWHQILATEIEQEWQTERDRSFDFWVGSWEANWRSRQEGEFHFAPEGSWTKQYVFPVLGGKAVLELAEQRNLNPEQPSGTGFSIRYFDETKNRWVMAQHWPSPGFPGIAFLDQLIAVSGHGRHEFYSHLARPNAEGGFDYRRYVFSDIGPKRFRWDGSNSSDEGKTWSTWNIVEFHRIEDFPDLETGTENLPTYHKGLLCDEEVHKKLDDIIGEWSGEVTHSNGSVEPAHFQAGRIADGCGVLGVISIPGQNYKLITAWAYTKYFDHWVNFRLDNQRGTRHEYRVSAGKDPETFSKADALRIEDEFQQIFIGDSLDIGRSSARTTIQFQDSDLLSVSDQVLSGQSGKWENERVFDLHRVR